MKKRNKSVIPVVCAALVVALSMGFSVRAQVRSPAAADSVERRFETLLAQIAALQERIEQLERRIAELEAPPSAEPAAPSAEPAAAPTAPAAAARIMMLEEVTTVEPDPSAKVRMESLRREAAELEKKAEALEKQAAEIKNDPSPYWTKEQRREAELENDRKRERLRQPAREFRNNARQLRGQAARIEKESLIPRQILRGWDGTQTVTLRTTTDQSATLHKTQTGSFIRWTGKLISRDSNGEVWEVTRIEIVQRPVDFMERP